MLKNGFPSCQEVEVLRKRYPQGCRVELVKMDDLQAPPIGTCGTVEGVDDMGSLLVSWDNGSHLNVIYGEDSVRILTGGDDFSKKTEVLEWNRIS